MAAIYIKGVYAPFKKTDGFRVLVDRLWPRGLTTETLHVDAWMKELAPSPCLRIWFKHHPEKWQVFCNSYFTELKVYCDTAALWHFCKEHKKITLLYASKNESQNHALLLQQYLNILQKKLPAKAGYSLLNYYYDR